jgi:hypothetical protein
MITFVHCPNVKTVGNEGFNACYALKRFYSKCLEEIGSAAFFGCVSLTEIDVSRVVTL